MSPEPFPDSPAGRRLRRGLGVRPFLSCWLVYVLHFAINTVREIVPALSLGDHFSFDFVLDYSGVVIGWSCCLAMARDVEQGLGVPEPLRRIATGGLRLPRLTTLQRRGT